MSFGIGFGAFAQGLTSGLGTGMKLGTAMKARQTQNNQQKAIDEAKKEYDAQMAAQPSASSQPGIGNAPGAAPAPQQSFEDFLYKNKMPQIIDNLVASGDLEGAERLRKWTDDRNERGFMKNFGKTLGAWAAGNSSGDYTQFADSAVDLLNKGGYGIKADGYEFIKDSDGKTTGLTFNLSDGKTKFKHTFNSMQDAANFLAAQGDPINRVKQWQEEQKKATELRAKVAEKQLDAQIGLGKETAVENVRQRGRLELEDRRADNQLRLEATKNRAGGKEGATDEYVIGLLRERGFNDDDVNTYIAGKYLGEAYRKGKSPQEFAQQIVVELAKDPMNARKSQDEIMRQAQALVDIAVKLGNQNQPQRPAARPQQNLPIYR